MLDPVSILSPLLWGSSFALRAVLPSAAARPGNSAVTLSSSPSPCCQQKGPGRGKTVPSACCSTEKIYSEGYSSRIKLQKEKYWTVRKCSAGLELNNGNSQEWGLLVASHTQLIQ